MSRRLGEIAAPFVVAPPAGVRVRTRLMADAADVAVLAAVGAHLGALAGADLARRCAEGRLDACGRAVSRRERKRMLTAAASSRWAGAITRTSDDAWALAERNLAAEARSLRARTGRIQRRLAVPAGGRQGKTRGYANQAERFEKQRRLQVLQARLAEAEACLSAGRMAVCRGGWQLARVRHHLAQAGLTQAQWRAVWEPRRWFICADGEAGKAWGNETIRWHPGEGWLELKLPAPLAGLANRPHGRYRLPAPVCFPYRGAEVAAQAATGAVRYDISFDPGKARWYLDASWQPAPRETPALAELRRGRVLAVDVNAGHLAAIVANPSGNPVGTPVTVPWQLDGLPASARDGRVRAAVSQLLTAAAASGCRAVAIEDLDFAQARQAGRERSGRRPSRGWRGRGFRRLVAGTPTARFRDRLTQMAASRGLAVVAVDPAYTSRWGAEHWLTALRTITPAASGHHAAALAIGRRSLGQRARRRERCDSPPPADGEERAANSAVRPTPAPPGLARRGHRKPGDRKAQGQPQQRRKTQTAQRAPPGHQGSKDRSRHPTGQGPALISV